MAHKPPFRPFHLHLSPEAAALLVLPAALAVLSATTAVVCAVIHWS